MKLGFQAIMLVAVVSAGAGPAAAQQTTHGCACLHNQTQAQISYRYKWGEGEWKTMQLKPGYNNWICWQYQNGQKSSPNLLFQLDVDMSKGSAGRPTPSDVRRPWARAVTRWSGRPLQRQLPAQHQQHVHPGDEAQLAAQAVNRE